MHQVTPKLPSPPRPNAQTDLNTASFPSSKRCNSKAKDEAEAEEQRRGERLADRVVAFQLHKRKILFQDKLRVRVRFKKTKQWTNHGCMVVIRDDADGGGMSGNTT